MLPALERRLSLIDRMQQEHLTMDTRAVFAVCLPTQTERQPC